jgi:hypothetical protein
MGDYFYRRQMKTGKEEIVPIKQNITAGVGDSTRVIMKKLTEGIYETSRYLLLNNKKSTN